MVCQSINSIRMKGLQLKFVRDAWLKTNKTIANAKINFRVRSIWKRTRLVLSELQALQLMYNSSILDQSIVSFTKIQRNNIPPDVTHPLTHISTAA